MTDEELIALLDSVPTDASEVRFDGETFREVAAAIRALVAERGK